MIAKNSERFMAASIEHILPYVDELVINISPGHDNTQNIAKNYWIKHPDKIKLFYCDAFDSVPTETGRTWVNEGFLRNWCIRKCTGDWILQQDADEFYDESFLSKMKEFLKDTDQNAIFFTKLNFWKSLDKYRVDGNWYPDVGGAKLFRNTPEISYVGGGHCTVWADYGKTIFIPNEKCYFKEANIFHFARAFPKPIGEEGSPEMLNEDGLKLETYTKKLPKSVELIKND
jgi:glycosyltransferase involved in cell wall biosynthesis